MIELSTDKAMFEEHREKVIAVNEHYDNCNFSTRMIPMDECPCDCYIKQIFKLGRQAERDSFYNS